ncbi:DUF3558 domain-containing protein [Amycolatopsis minnesotensis]|uniref:DUF3558 domain-containing protein n=1 Tax=Amycolatopsis minnesotensis TaxID=337894 RepID=A0ABP5BH40_9PSEU
MRIPVHPGVLAVLSAVALLAGCGQAKTAEPVPPAASMRATTPPSSEAPAGLGSLDPCGLLSSADRSSAGLSVLGKPKAIGQAKGCDWTEPGTFGVTVTVDAEHAPAELSENNTDKGTRRKTKAGDRTAYEVADREAANGVCAVLVNAGKGGSASVDVSNANFRDTDLACERAKTVAGLIAPKLP